jgi:hypothetical protein
MPAMLIILAVVIAVALYFDREETDSDKHDDPKRLRHSTIVAPRR